jgi:hypothetical protein
MNIDTLIDELHSLREQKRKLEQEIKQVNEQYNETKAYLIDLLDAQGVSSVKTPVARVTMTESQVVKMEDWESFCRYITDNNAFHLLQKRPASTACKEHLTITNELPPGIHLITLRDISLTTNRNAQ